MAERNRSGIADTDHEGGDLTLGDVRGASIKVVNLSVLLPPKLALWRRFSRRITRCFGQKIETTAVRHILENVSADIPAGTLTGIIGASGSGKTSLLNIISGQFQASFSGQILFNGSKWKRDSVRMAYVMQDDFLIPNLTVRETLQYAADLRLPFHNHLERTQIVEQTISDLGLEGCGNTLIGNGVEKGCSGGEKRRTSIGIQLLANPSCLLCDEPTTGLDAASAYHVMDILKTLARKGKTVVVSVHSPRVEIWTLLDHVMILALGSMVYNGRTDRALEHFDKHGYSITPEKNYAEHLVNLIAVDNRTASTRSGSLKRIESLRDIWQNVSTESEKKNSSYSCSDSSSLESLVEPLPSEVSYSQQLHALTARTFKTTLRDPTGIVSVLLLSISLGAITGWTYFSLDGSLEGIRSKQSAFYSVTSIYGYLVMMYEVYRLTIDIRIFDRERRDRVVDILPFVLSRRAAKLPLEDLPSPILFAVICYWMVGFEKFTPEFFVFLLLVILTNYIALTFAMVAVAITREFALATLVGNMFYNLQSMAGGYLIQTNQIPVYVRWTKWITHTFYIFGAFCTNEFMGLGGSSQGRFYDCPSPKDPSSESCKEYTGKFIIHSLGFPEDWSWKPLIILPVFFLVYQITAMSIFWLVEPAPSAIRPGQDDQPLSKGGGEIQPLNVSTPVHPVMIQLSNFGLSTVRPKKLILQNVSTTFKPGMLNIVMGPSGSGKTSILNAVTGNNLRSTFRKHGTEGQILYNGQPLPQRHIQSIVSYVNQDDHGLPPFLTVRELLRFTARLRLPKDMAKVDIEQRIEAVLYSMGLLDCAETMIGDENHKGISGGEKRRVSISMQLLHNPQILVLDEPTSGLDAFTSASILDLLNNLAVAGRTVIMSIHQPPSSFFGYPSNVLLLAPGGSTVYTGSCQSILPYFNETGYSCPSHTNPADFVIDNVSIDPRPGQQTASWQRIEHLVSTWKSTQRNCLQESPPDSNLAELNQLKRPRNPFTHLFPILLHRSTLHLWRQPIVLFSGVWQGWGLSLFLMLFYAPLQYNYSGVQTIAGLLLQFASLLFIGIKKQYTYVQTPTKLTTSFQQASFKLPPSSRQNATNSTEIEPTTPLPPKASSYNTPPCSSPWNYFRLSSSQPS